MAGSEKVKKILLCPAKCAVDLGDGSERGEYVNQDYILHKIGRPHRAINLMYCYYPLDKGWPGRASVAHAHPDVQFAWDYPYDDYFTYKGGIGGTTDDEPFTYMKDVRRHGQDVILTLTCDPHVSDEHLIKIAEELNTFGRMQLRINHEATGSWFSFNKRCSYQEVADFYVRFHKIVKEYAPQVKTILCIGGIENLSHEEMEKEKEFTEAVRNTDIWSVDKYMALHWGWPYDIAEPGGNSHQRSRVSDIFEMTKRSYERYKFLNDGEVKPMVMSEFNADGDVTGPYDQCDMIKEFCDMLKNEPADWFSGFTFYQFRDRGRLGLEIEDPNNPDVGIEQPSMKTYKEIVHDEYFYPEIKTAEEISFPVKLRWGGSEDAEGVEIPLHFESNPVFCEITFSGADKGLNAMMEINGKWFYKSPKATTIDLISAFFDKPVTEACDMTLKIFTPPASGENNPNSGDDWRINDYTVINEMPDIRLRFNPTAGGATRDYD